MTEKKGTDKKEPEAVVEPDFPTDKAGVLKALCKVQNLVSVPKDMYNGFAKYHYRNAESIMNAVKPVLLQHGLSMTVRDEVTTVGDFHYVIAIVEINGIEVGKSYAREPMSKKGMDDSQITGSTSSYARKYALNGVFLLDDVKDADSMDNSNHNSGMKTASSVPKNTPVKDAVSTKEQKEKDARYSKMLDGYKENLGEKGFDAACAIVSETDPYKITDRELRVEMYNTLKACAERKANPSG